MATKKKAPAKKKVTTKSTKKKTPVRKSPANKKTTGTKGGNPGTM
jgi:hypothetical protein